MLVLDGEPPPHEEGIEWVTPDSIGVERAALHVMAAMYDVIELATAMKPALLRWMLLRSESVLYLDPDISVHAPLGDLLELARDHGVVVTPHRLTPARQSGRPIDRELLVAGAFNLGFLGIGRTGSEFLEWWAGHLRYDCVVAPDEGLFVDQRWAEFGTTLFPHVVVRDPGCNVAWWNLDEREISLVDGALRVGAAPLRFFHFSGFDPGYPDFLYHRAKHPAVR